MKKFIVFLSALFLVFIGVGPAGATVTMDFDAVPGGPGAPIGDFYAGGTGGGAGPAWGLVFSFAELSDPSPPFGIPNAPSPPYAALPFIISTQIRMDAIAVPGDGNTMDGFGSFVSFDWSSGSGGFLDIFDASNTSLIGGPVALPATPPEPGPPPPVSYFLHYHLFLSINPSVALAIIL